MRTVFLICPKREKEIPMAITIVAKKEDLP